MKARCLVSKFTRLRLQPTLFLSVLISISACGGGGGGGGVTTSVSPPPPPSRMPQTVVFLATEPNLQQDHLFSASDEGGALRQLTSAFTNANGAVRAFSISPDRQTVAYVADADVAGTLDLFVVPVSSGVPVPVSSGFPANTFIAEIAWAPDSSQVAYIANPQGRSPRGFILWEVFLADRDGSNNRKINGSVGTPPMVSLARIKWSPDSRYLAQTVFILDPFLAVIGLNTFDTTLGVPNSTRITPTLNYLNGERHETGFAWSPDSTQIAYRSSYQDAATTHLYAVRPDGSGNVRMDGTLVAGGDVLGFKWAPDGSQIAFHADKLVDRRADLFVTNSTGNNSERINSGSVLTGLNQYTWAPDSRRLLYVTDQDTAMIPEIYISNVDGNVAVKASPPLTTGQFADSVAWSPDGQRIAYRSNKDSVTETEVYLSNADGSGLIKLNGPMVTNGQAARSLKWSPDGARVAYVASQNDSNVQDLFVSTIDGLSNNRVNADLSGANADIHFLRYNWSNDSTRIMFYDVLNNSTNNPLDVLDIWVGTTDGAAPITLNGSNDFLGDFDY